MNPGNAAGPRDTPPDALRLRMRRAPGPVPEMPALPAGVVVRTFEEGDAPGLRAVLETGTFGAWPAERLNALFAHGIDRLDDEGLHLAVHAGQVIGHCCLMVRDEPEGVVGKLGWVVVDPEWRGRGIGRAVCVSALRDAARRGIGTVVLGTEAFREAAVRLYLDLGFAPVRGDGRDQDRFWDRFA